jgi:hypothetical protein
MMPERPEPPKLRTETKGLPWAGALFLLFVVAMLSLLFTSLLKGYV